MPEQRSLRDDVTAAFEGDSKEGKWQVIKCVLQALDTLACRQEAKGRTNRAYSELVCSLRRETQCWHLMQLQVLG